MNKVRPGQPLKISANDWNAIADVVNDAKRKSDPLLSAAIASGVNNAIIRGYNTSGETIPAFTAVEILDVFPNIDYSLEEVPAQSLQFSRIRPATGNGAPYAITQDEILPTHCGRCLVYGITSALFKSLEPIETGAYADPAPDAPGSLKIASSGMARVLSAPSSTASSYTTILLLGGGGGGTAPAAPQPFDLRVGTLNGERTIEVYLPDGAVFYADTPAPEFVGSAPNIAARPSALSVGGGWYVWKTFSASSTASGTLLLNVGALMYGSTEERAYALYSKDSDGTLYREDSEAGTSTPDALPSAAPLIEIGAYTITAGEARVDQLRVGPFRASFCSGGEGLYTTPPLIGGDGEDVVYTRVTEGEPLTAETWLWWILLPMGAIFDGAGAVCRGYAIDWPTIPLAYTFNRLRAVTHAALHFSSFVPQE